MELSKNITQGKWTEIKGEVQKAWGKLTDDELEKTKGDIKVIGGLIQQRYGEAQKNYHEKLSNIFQNIEEKKEEVLDKTKKILKK
ncbi:MAG: CsbD family protein [Bacteriovorax sp.]|nr:CsbD family protein [Bacteriovorax sp.]